MSTAAFGNFYTEILSRKFARRNGQGMRAAASIALARMLLMSFHRDFS
jgi:SET domain-containing protein